MAFFVGEREQGRANFFNVDRARRIVHDTTSVDRARWVLEFGFLIRTTIVIQRDSQASAYDKLTAYFSENSTGV